MGGQGRLHSPLVSWGRNQQEVREHVTGSWEGLPGSKCKDPEVAMVHLSMGEVSVARAKYARRRVEGGVVKEIVGDKWSFVMRTVDLTLSYVR